MRTPDRCVMSPALREAIRNSSFQRQQLALRVGMHPSRLSAYLAGFPLSSEMRERLIKIGALVGVPADRCFAKFQVAE